MSTLPRRLLCLLGFHYWTEETHGSYLYCLHCQKYNIWRGRKP